MPSRSALIATAQEQGRLYELGRTLRIHAARRVSRLPKDTVLFVDIHPVELHDPELYTASAPLSRHAQRVVLQLTDIWAVAEIEDLPRRIEALRRLGFRIAINDRGPGSASLLSFAQVQPDVVKIDLTGCQNDEPKPSVTALHAILEFCQRIEADVICTGIRSPAEFRALAQYGNFLMQGPLFSEPERTPSRRAVERKTRQLMAAHTLRPSSGNGFAA